MKSKRSRAYRRKQQKSRRLMRLILHWSYLKDGYTPLVSDKREVIKKYIPSDFVTFSLQHFKFYHLPPLLIISKLYSYKFSAIIYDELKLLEKQHYNNILIQLYEQGYMLIDGDFKRSIFQ